MTGRDLFKKVRDVCHWAAGHFYRFGAFCQNLPFIGGLAWYLKETSYELDGLGYRFSTIADVIGDIENRIRDTLRSWEVVNALATYARPLYDFYRDPMGFIREKVADILDLGWHDLSGGSAFIRALIDKYMGTLYDFYRDPWGFIRERIEGHLHDFRFWMGNVLGLTPWEINYPERWVEFMIDRRMPKLYVFWKHTLPEFSGFFRDPRDHIRLWMANLLNLSPYEANYPERWIEYIIVKAYPGWPQLRADPGGYITEQLISYIERRVADLFERIGWLAQEIVARLLGV